MSMLVWESVALKLTDTHQIDDIITKVELGDIKWNTLKALTDREILTKVDENNFRFTSIYEKKVALKESNSSDHTFKIHKSHNQYYAQYVEEGVTALVNNESIPNNVKNFSFKDWECDFMNTGISRIAGFLKNLYGESARAIYTGRRTGSESCDIIIDDQEVEIKYCKKDNSTYFNTSVSYFDSYGLESLKNYMIKYGVYDLLVPYFGDSVFEGKSPITDAKEASAFSKKYADFYKKVYLPKEHEARAAYVQMVYEFFSNNPEALDTFVQDMLTKAPAGKHIPDLLLIYHYDLDEIVTFTKEEILNMSGEIFEKRRDFTFQLKGFHITIAWQNCTGLNNPTIRVFIDKKGN